MLQGTHAELLRKEGKGKYTEIVRNVNEVVSELKVIFLRAAA